MVPSWQTRIITHARVFFKTDSVSLHVCTTQDLHLFYSGWTFRCFCPGVVNSNSTDTHVQLSLSGSHSLLSFVCPEVCLLDHVDIVAKKVSEKLNNGHQSLVGQWRSEPASASLTLESTLR